MGRPQPPPVRPPSRFESAGRPAAGSRWAGLEVLAPISMLRSTSHPGARAQHPSSGLMCLPADSPPPVPTRSLAPPRPAGGGAGQAGLLRHAQQPGGGSQCAPLQVRAVLAAGHGAYGSTSASPQLSAAATGCCHCCCSAACPLAPTLPLLTPLAPRTGSSRATSSPLT